MDTPLKSVILLFLKNIYSCVGFFSIRALRALIIVKCLQIGPCGPYIEANLLLVWVKVPSIGAKWPLIQGNLPILKVISPNMGAFAPI